MIITKCKFTGIPFAATEMFSGTLIANDKHPIFSLSLQQLLDMAAERKVYQYNAGERVLLSVALLRTTGLLKFRDHPHLLTNNPNDGQLTSLLFVAAEVAKTVAVLRETPQRSKAVDSNCPFYAVDGEASAAGLYGWSKLIAKIVAGIHDRGRAPRMLDDSYYFAAHLFGETEPKKNTDYELPQVVDATVCTIVFNKLNHSLTQAERNVKATMLADISRIMQTERGVYTPAQLNFLLDRIPKLKGNTASEVRCLELVGAHLLLIKNEQTERTAKLLGEAVEVETTTIHSKTFSVTVLAPAMVGGAGGAMVERERVSIVKGSRSEAATPQTLDNETSRSNMHLNQPAIPAASIRAKLASKFRK